MRKTGATFVILLTLFLAHSFAGQGNVLLSEDFNDLENWKPLNFPKIKEHSTYTIEKSGEAGYLKMASNASASALVFKKRFNVSEYPRLRWRWKVTGVMEKGDARKKAGDDYPARVYVIFEYDPGDAGFFEKVKYESAKLLYGEYPPRSSLNYIWANRKHDAPVLTSTYTEQVKLIPLRAGEEGLGKWVTEEVNILGDYRRAFGEDPPEVASLAVMCDSDNTGESARSYIDYIEVFR